MPDLFCFLRRAEKLSGRPFQARKGQISRAPGIFLDRAFSQASIGIPVPVFSTCSRFLEQREMSFSSLKRERGVRSQPLSPCIGLLAQNGRFRVFRIAPEIPLIFLQPDQCRSCCFCRHVSSEKGEERCVSQHCSRKYTPWQEHHANVPQQHATDALFTQSQLNFSFRLHSHLRARAQYNKLL